MTNSQVMLMNFHSDFIGKREQNVVMTELSVLLKLKLKETIIFDFGGCLIYLEKISVHFWMCEH